MARRLIFTVATAAILAGCGESGCDDFSIHEDILLREGMLLRDDIAGSKQITDFKNSITNVSQVKKNGERLVCEAQIQTQGTLAALAMRLQQTNNSQVGDWVKNKEWLRTVNGIFTALHDKEFADSIKDNVLTAKTKISYSVEPDNDKGFELVAYRFEDKSDFYGYDIANQIKPDFDAFLQQRHLKEEKKAKELGYRDLAHKHEVEKRIENAKGAVSKNEANLKRIEKNLFKNKGLIGSLEQKISLNQESIKGLQVQAESFEKNLKSKVVITSNSALQLSGLKIVKGQGAFRKPTVKIVGKAKNISSNLIDHARLSGVTWSDRAGEIKLDGSFIYFGKEGVEPGQTKDISVTLYDDFMPSSGETDIKIYAKSNDFGYWGSVKVYEDGRGEKHWLDLGKDPRKAYRNQLSKLASDKEKYKSLVNDQAQYEKDLTKYKLALSEAQEAYKAAVNMVPESSS